jgi:hypothetical protein
MKKFDLKKEELRGSIKQLMTVRGLRMINLANYNAWAGNVDKKLVNIHSIKIDIMTGFVNLYTNGNGGRAGQKLDDVHVDIYKKVYNRVLEIFKHEGDIPGDLKRNILVRVSR